MNLLECLGLSFITFYPEALRWVSCFLYCVHHVLFRGSQVGVFCIVCIFSTVKFDILKTYISKLRYVEMSLKSHAL